MNGADVIQFLILVVLALSLGAMVVTQVAQALMARAQLMSSRMTAYRWVLEPVTDEHVRDCEAYPEMVMTLARYEERYRGDPERLRRYLKLTRIYEYLAFAHGHKRRGIARAFRVAWGKDWSEWMVRDPMFWEVDEYYGQYHPAFSKHLRALGAPLRAKEIEANDGPDDQ